MKRRSTPFHGYNSRYRKKGNDMTTETKEKEKKPDFEPGDVSDIYDKLSAHSFALKAFGELLRTSDLNAFTDDAYGKEHPDTASNMRWGLSQIIELYLDHQERILSEHLDEYHKSDAVLIKRAKISLSMVEQGTFTSRKVSANNLRKAISNLDIVINQRGDLEGKAHELKSVCLKYIEQLTGNGKTGT
jgi:hypothetical protein